MAQRSPLPAHVPLWYRTQDTHREEKTRQVRERREYRGVEFYMDAPVGTADSWGDPLWSWPCLTMPGCTVRRSAGARHGYGSSPLIHQQSLPLGEKLPLCRFDEKS
jgi:hypothetical protein